eukprot:jgi/Mesvir1/2572/Mv10317-RA.1
MAPGFHSARSFFGAGFRSTRDRSSGSWWRSKDGSGTVGGDGFGTEGDEDGGEDGRGRSGSRCPWKGGRRAVAAEVPVADFGREEERYACVNLNARDAPPPVTPQVMRWAEDVRRERRESRVVGKLRLPPPVTTGVLKWAVEANERGEGAVLGPGLFRDLHYYRELRGSIWYIDARPRRSRGSDAKIRRRAGSAPSTPLGRARGRLRTVPEASNEEEGGRSRTGRRRGACRTRRGPLGGPVLAPCEVGRVPPRGGLGDPGARVQRSGARRAARPRPGGMFLHGPITFTEFWRGLTADERAEYLKKQIEDEAAAGGGRPRDPRRKRAPSPDPGERREGLGGTGPRRERAPSPDPAGRGEGGGGGGGDDTEKIRKLHGLVKRLNEDDKKKALEKFHSAGSNVDEVLAQIEAELLGGPYAPAGSGTSGGTGPASGPATSGGGDPAAGDPGPAAGGDTSAVADGTSGQGGQPSKPNSGKKKKAKSKQQTRGSR